MEILKKDNKVKRIYFLSDIHIKNDPIHNDIYYSVFDNLYKKYTNEKVNKDDLIVITGDIMDNGYTVTKKKDIIDNKKYYKNSKNTYIYLGDLVKLQSIICYNYFSYIFLHNGHVFEVKTLPITSSEFSIEICSSSFHSFHCKGFINSHCF